MKSRTIFITAARSQLAVDLARALHRAGHRVLAGDRIQTLCNHSSCVDRVVPLPGPRNHPRAFIAAINHWIGEEQIDLVIPLYEEVLYLAYYYHLLHRPEVILAAPFATLNQLHSKFLFQKTLTQLGLPALRTQPISEYSQLAQLSFEGPYALKACYSRAAFEVYRVDPPSPAPQITIDPWNPWVAQEWVEGRRYCSYSLCRQGQVVAHSCYPVQVAIDGYSCVNFKEHNHPAILEWVKTLVSSLNFHGQISFDFVESNGRLYSFECNPRATSGLHLLTSEPELAGAFLGEHQTLITPSPKTSRQILAGMLLYGWRSPFAREHPLQYLRSLLTTPDVIFDLHDLKPLFAQPLLLRHIFQLSHELNLSIPQAFIYDFSWNNR